MSLTDNSIKDTLTNGTRLAAEPAYWFKDIQKQGIAAFNPNPSAYKVFRNVMDYGARGEQYYIVVIGPITK